MFTARMTAATYTTLDAGVLVADAAAEATRCRRDAAAMKVKRDTILYSPTILYYHIILPRLTGPAISRRNRYLTSSPPPSVHLVSGELRASYYTNDAYCASIHLLSTYHCTERTQCGHCAYDCCCTYYTRRCIRH
eukprot:7379166-Prymnesium_polylepis.1